nr:hypothetical protein [Tanacetum cinerariifolium]
IRKSKNKVSISIDDNIIPEPDVALELRKYISLSEAEEEVTSRVHATHERLVLESNELSGEPANRPINKRRPSGVSHIQKAQVKELVLHQRFPMSQQSSLQPQVKELGSKEESEYSEEDKVDKEIKWVCTDEEKEKQDDQDEDNDRSIDIERTGDEEEIDDEFMRGDEYVNDNVDEGMKDVEFAVTGKDVQELKQVDQSLVILATIRSQVPTVVDEYLGSSLRYALQKEQAEKQQMPEYSIKSFDKAAHDEYDQKSTLFQTMIKSKSFNKHPSHKALYYALMESLLADKEGMDQGVADLLKKKRQHDDQKEDLSAHRRANNDSKKFPRSRLQVSRKYFAKVYQVKDQDPRSQAYKRIFKMNSQEYKAPRLKTSQEGSTIE